MILNFKKSLLLLIIAVTIACKKDNPDEKTSFPTKLYAEKVQTASKIRVFTRNGEIKDLYKIEKFARDGGYPFNLQEIGETLGYTHLTFFSKDSMLFNGGSLTNMREVKRSGNQFLIPQNWSLRLYSSQPHFSTYLGKYDIFWTESEKKYTKAVMLASGNYKALEFHFFSWMYPGRMPGDDRDIALPRYVGIWPNEFNERLVVSMMGPRDTIAIKAYTQKFR